MKNPIKKYRIEYLLSGSLVIFFVLLLAIVCWVSYSVSSKELAENTSHYQQELMSELNKQMMLQLRTVEQQSLVITRDAKLLDLLVNHESDYYVKLKAQNDFHKYYLSEIVNSTPSIQSIVLYVKQPVFSDPGGDISFVEHDRMLMELWYPLIEKSDFAWFGERMIETNLGPQKVVTFARKIYSSSLEYQGLLLINVKAKVLYNIMLGEKPSAKRYLLDSGGRIIMGTADANYGEIGLLEQVNNTQSGTGYSHQKRHKGIAGEDLLLVWAKSFNDGWVMFEVTPWMQITEGSLKLALTLFWIGLGAVLTGLLFALYLSRSFTKPIRLLLNAMGKFPNQPKQVDLPEDYSNEFGYLFSGYRRLTRRIDELYRSLDRQHQRQRKAEIKALQAMINPHFLYNTLDQLNWMAIEAGHDRMSHVLELMGRMFRIGLSNGESLITLEQELMHTECYLQIQQLRWSEGLTYSISADEHVKLLSIPKLTLQPFVENTIIHGFHGRTTGHIEIVAVIDESALVISICDNGVGLSKDWNQKTGRKIGGYGIRNVRERMEAYFGYPYGFTLTDVQTGGTLVSIRIPKQNYQQQGGNKDVENSSH